MARRAVSLTIADDNLLWLRGRAGHRDGNLSAVVDQLIADARIARVGSSTPARSVVGTIDLSADDPELSGADAAVREMFAASLSQRSLSQRSLSQPSLSRASLSQPSLSRPSVARESSPNYRVATKPRKAKPTRG